VKAAAEALADITLLGGFLVRRPAGGAISLPTKKAQALLAYLAVPPGQAHPRDKLSSLLWGDMQEPQARASLRQAIFAIRKALPPSDLLSQEGGSVALRSDAVQVDVAAFEHATRLWTVVLEISVMMAQYPSRRIAELSYRYGPQAAGMFQGVDVERAVDPAEPHQVQ
jgi:two-component SAPR family response regulator